MENQLSVRRELNSPERGHLRVWIADDVADHWTVPDKCTPKGDPVNSGGLCEKVVVTRMRKGHWHPENGDKA